MDGDCLFCRIATGEQPAKIVHRDEEVVAFEDVSPQAPTHVLVVPRKHIPTVDDLTPEDEALVGKLFTTARRIAADRGIAEGGYRLVVNCNRGAGQSIFHLHLHLLGGRPFGWPPG